MAAVRVRIDELTAKGAAVPSRRRLVVGASVALLLGTAMALFHALGYL
jgi:hypothetical protein